MLQSPSTSAAMYILSIKTVCACSCGQRREGINDWSLCARERWKGEKVITFQLTCELKIMKHLMKIIKLIFVPQALHYTKDAVHDILYFSTLQPLKSSTFGQYGRK